MSPLTLNDLPVSPPGKAGWPWSEETPSLPTVQPDGSTWPLVSVVTPSYNQGQFLEETIRSVLLQGYPNLEYFIVDGGSSDNSLEIIKKYESWLTGWVSQPDQGQSDALNKGFARSNGLILSWLNSDDRLQPEAIQTAVDFLLRHPDLGLVYGDYREIDQNGQVLGVFKAPEFDLEHQVVRQLIPQPAAFFSRALWEQLGPLNIEFHYVMDRDLWTRAALHFPVRHILTLMADMRLHDSSKTVDQAPRFMHEIDRFFDGFFALPDLPSQLRALEPQARGANYFSLGRHHLKGQQYQPARIAFERALKVYPFRLDKLIILLFWLDSILKTNLALPLFRLATRLKNGQMAPD